MLVISISSADLCLHKNKENVNGRASFVIVVAERWASFYHIYDWQNVLASDISLSRPIWTWISMIEKSINLLERESTRFWPFRNTNVFNWGERHFGKWNFLNSNISIWIMIAGIANFF